MEEIQSWLILATKTKAEILKESFKQRQEEESDTGNFYRLGQFRGISFLLLKNTALLGENNPQINKVLKFFVHFSATNTFLKVLYHYIMLK